MSVKLIDSNQLDKVFFFPFFVLVYCAIKCVCVSKWAVSNKFCTFIVVVVHIYDISFISLYFDKFRGGSVFIVDTEKSIAFKHTHVLPPTHYLHTEFPSPRRLQLKCSVVGILLYAFTI